MKWRFRKKDPRYVKKFAIFPVVIGNECRWLETVYYRRDLLGTGCLSGSPYYSDAVSFVTKEEYERAVDLYNLRLVKNRITI